MPKIFAAVCVALFAVSARAEGAPCRVDADAVDAAKAQAPQPSTTEHDAQPVAVLSRIGPASSAQRLTEGAPVRAAHETAATHDAASATAHDAAPASPATFDGSQYRKQRGLGGREPIGERVSDAPDR